MMTRILLAIIAAAAFVFMWNPAEAAKVKTSEVGTIPIPIDDAKKYNATTAPVFDVNHFINAAGVDIYVVTEDFGLLNIESDVHLDRPLQREEKSEERDMLLDFGYQVAQYIVPALYGVAKHEIHTGNVYIGVPSLAPEGSITLVDVRFVRDGLLYPGRVGILTTDFRTNRPEDQMWFAYPLTR